jgi:hypothetical protein
MFKIERWHQTRPITQRDASNHILIHPWIRNDSRPIHLCTFYFSYECKFQHAIDSY